MNEEKVVSLVLPKNKKIIEEKYAEVMADVVAEMLTNEELNCLISKLEN